MSDERANETPARPYRPPQRLLVPCPHCGTVVLRGLIIDGLVRKQIPPLTPVLGEKHVCQQEKAV